VSDNFSVSVELKGKSTGVDQIQAVRTAIIGIGTAAKETTKLATESARELARAWSQSVKGDVATNMRQGLGDAQAQVDTLTQRLRALYTLKMSGNPVANLGDAIKVVESDLENAQNELKKFNALTQITEERARGMSTAMAASFKGNLTQALNTGMGQARAQIDSITAKLKNLYALRATGNPMAGLHEAIQAVEQDLREAQFQMNQLHNTTLGAANLSEQMGVGSFVKGLLSAQIITLAIRESWLAIKSTISAIVGEGLKMNEELESYTLGIAANLTALYEMVDANGQRLEGEAKYTAALEMSKKQMYELRKAGLATAATSQQLGKSFQSALAVAGSAGIKDLDKIRELTIGVANAATALVIPQEEAVVALRAIISGREVEQSTLARTLVTSGENVRNMQKQADFVDQLIVKLKPYTDAANRNATAWKVVKSNVEETFQVFSGELTAGLFDKLKMLGLEFMGILDPSNLGIVERFQPLIAVLQNMFAAVGNFVVEIVHGALAAAEAVSTMIKNNETAINGWFEGAVKVWGIFKTTLVNLTDMLVVVYEVGSALGAWEQALAGVKAILLGATVAVAALSDGFRAIGTIIVSLGALIANQMLKPIGDFLAEYSVLIGAITPGVQASELESAGKRIQKTVSNINSSAQGMWKQFENGLPAINRMLDAFEKKSGKLNIFGSDKDIKKMVDDMRAAISGLLGGDDKTDAAAAKKAAELAERIAKARQEAALAFEKARLEGENKLLDNQLKIQEISITDYYTRKTQLALESIGEERKAREAALSAMGTGADNEPERVKIQNELNILKLQEGSIIEENRVKQREALNELITQIGDVKTQLNELQGTTSTDDITANLASKFSTLRDTLVKQFGEGSESVNLLDTFLDVKGAQEKFNLLKTQYDQTLTEMQAKEVEIRKQQAAGTLSPIDALNQLNDVNKEYVATLDQLLPRLEEYANKVGSPELKLKLEDIKTKVTELKTAQNDFGKTMGDAINSGWVEMWQSFADGTKSAGEAFKDFARSVLSTFTKMMTEIIAKAMMAKMLSSMGSAGGGWGALFSTAFNAMSKADGGYIAGPGTGTSDSIPARLSNGEYVIKAASVRRVGVPFLDALNGGRIKRGGNFFAEGGLAVSPSAGSSDSRLTVGLEDGLVVRSLDTPAGSKAVLRVIENNPQLIRSLLR